MMFCERDYTKWSKTCQARNIHRQGSQKSIYPIIYLDALPERKPHPLGETWGKRFALAVKPWENNWADLVTFFAYPAEIRRLIYTTNAIEGYHWGLRKVIKIKASFPTAEAARKLLYLAHQNITKK